MKEINPENLNLFLNNIEQQRKTLPTIRQIEREAGIAQGYLNRILQGDKPLTEETINKLRPVLAKYKF